MEESDSGAIITDDHRPIGEIVFPWLKLTYDYLGHMLSEAKSRPQQSNNRTTFVYFTSDITYQRVVNNGSEKWCSYMYRWVRGMPNAPGDTIRGGDTNKRNE